MNNTIAVPITRLPVINDIYNLGLTPNDFIALNSVIEKYISNESLHNHGTDSVKYIIKKNVLPNKILVWSLVNITAVHILGEYEIHGRVLANIPEKSFVFKNFIFQFEPSIELLQALRATNSYRIVGTDILGGDEDDSIYRFFSTEEEFKQYVWGEHFSDFDSAFFNIGGVYVSTRRESISIDETNNRHTFLALKWLFNIQEAITIKLHWNLPEYVTKISKVFEFNNRRMAIYAFRPANMHEFAQTYVGYVDETHPAYNYLDQDTLCAFPGSDEIPKLFFQGNITQFPPSDILRSTIRGQRFTLLDENAIKLAIRRVAMEEQERKEKEEMAKTLQKRLSEKIMNLADKQKMADFSFNEVTVKNHEFTYAGQTIKDATGLINIHDICQRINSAHNAITPDNFNFDILLENFCKTVVAATSSHRMTGQMSDVTYDIQQTVNSAGNPLFYVNGIRINKDEVLEVLQHALCYRTTEEYTRFVRSVSLCSLRFHRFLSTGIEVSVRDAITGVYLVFKLFLQRIRNKNHVIIKDKHFKISDTNRLLTLTNAKDMDRVIEVLMDPDTVGVSGSDIRILIDEGVRMYAELKKKEQEMLESVTKKLGIERIEHPTLNTSNAVIEAGYIVKGKLRTYLVTDEDQPKTYDYPSGSYRCIVEKNSGQYSKIQKILARFYNLVNDSAVVDVIHTLK